MRPALSLLLLVVAAPASAQAISGTFSASFSGFNELGVPTTHLELRLMCSLSCPMSRPQLHYRVATGTDAWFIAAPTERLGYLSAFFGADPSGVNVVDTTTFSPGVAFKVIAKGASCHCGNAVGEGGYTDIETSQVVIPPFPFVGTSKGRVGDEWYQNVNAMPQGSETVVVRFVGAGLDTQVTLAPSDFSGNSSSKTAVARVTPTAPGVMTVTATLQPYGASHTAMVTVNARSGGSGGGAGGGSGGGGEAGGGGTDEELGCTAAPAGLLLPLAVLGLFRRRRRG